MRLPEGFPGAGGRGKKLIEDGDGDANVAQFCLMKLHLLPSQFLALPREERAFLYACLDLYIQAEQRRQKEMDRIKSKNRGRRRR